MQSQLVAHLLHTIADNQSVNARFFTNGLLPSYRYNPAWGYKRPDQNLFFTAISVFTLQRLRSFLTIDEKAIADTIIARALPAFPHFRNKDGLATYNFYATQPGAHFPHGWLMHRFRHFKLPDDIDDTAMVYLTTKPSADELHFLTTKLAQHANRTRLTIQNTFQEYRDLRAYSTWFGLAMPIEFDACAIANMLYGVYEYGLPIDVHARDSLIYIADLISTDRYRTDPFRSAHNYARTPLIQYHIARLIGTFDPELLQPVRQKLIDDVKAAFLQSNSRLDQVLLAISLMRLGKIPPATIQLSGIEHEFASFSFFLAGMLSAYPQPWLYRWANRPFWHIKWRCDDHCRILLVEYLVLQRRLTPITA
ncbi:hypothetical protein [Fibrella aquatica]|uniref:hypothetical protein n=1 Tax=Fibrella aquatica TaxID=3242487 RepID=UPI003522469F